MKLQFDRAMKACGVVAEELMLAAREEEKQFSFMAEFHVDGAGYVRAVKVSKPSKQKSREITK